MGKSLVVVESPAKAKTINKILGGDFVVLPSMGHVRDLPQRKLGVDVAHGFAPTYELVEGRKKVISDLKSAARGSDAVYLAPDPDREGEAIAWHLEEILRPGNKGKPFYRVQYNEITPTAVRRAFEQPGQIDMRRVEAQQTRRVLDRLVGYRVSPLLWRRIARFLSAGRVQSVALRLVCEREAEIRAFVPEAFWILGAVVHKRELPVDPFSIRLAVINGEKAEIKSAERAAAIEADLKDRSLRVAAIKTKRVTKRPGPPYITSTLQQAGSSAYGLSPSRTMSIAQKLYEGVDVDGATVGLITYMRTDSFNVSRDAVQACRALIAEQFGERFVPETPNAYRSRASAQEAHEAIRPTDVRRTPESVARYLDAAGLKVYTLIWKRFVASQMAPAEIDQRTAEVEALPLAAPVGVDAAAPGSAPASYLFRAGASEIVFPGYMKVFGVTSVKERDDKEKEGEEDEAEETLPPLREGEPLDLDRWTGERKETKPPPRFSEAALVRELERNGVGRPSTYAQIVSTLHSRKYVAKQERALAPTDLGMRVNDYLVANLGELFDVGFTAQMEQRLDEIEEGKENGVTMLGAFNGKLNGWLANTAEPPADQGAAGEVLTALEKVREWAAPEGEGKRAFDDRKFVDSVRRQWSGGEKPLSQRQLGALLRLAGKYKDQAPEIAQAAAKVGAAHEVSAGSAASGPPQPSTIRKLKAVARLELNDFEKKFTASIRRRVDGGRALSDAQIRVLDRIVSSHAANIPDFETLRPDLGAVAASESASPDPANGPLLEMAQAIQQWKEPVKRGKRVFDDREFVESLKGQFARKRALSPRQQAALRKLVARYRQQIPDYEARIRALASDGDASLPQPPASQDGPAPQES
jgi:DNA topoisomerase-1